VHRWQESLESGLKDETVLDGYFKQWYDIAPASETQQRDGIDRIFTCRETGRRFTVEYKADGVAVRTGNAFVETWSVAEDDRRGWAYTSCAQMLIYFVPQSGAVYMASMLQIKEMLKEWAATYKEKSVKNSGKNGNPYTTKGLPVPLPEFAKCCFPARPMVPAGE